MRSLCRNSLLTPVPRRDGPAAFTLVEVLVATVVLAIGLLGVLTAFSIASRVAAASTNDTMLTFLAQEKLSEIQLLGREEITVAPTAGDFAPTYPEYRWEMIVHAPDELNVTRVDVVITTPESGRERESWFTTNIF
jgi:prepilin-type N-terminal cleavage/methylation domain-containing protein